MQVLETASEHLMLFFSCTAKCAVKKRDKTSGYIHSFTSQAEQFTRALSSKNNNRISMFIDHSHGFLRDDELDE